MAMADPAVTYCFDLEIEGLQLGTFTKVDGLTAKYETKAVVEGGENGFVHNLPGRVTYDNIKLTRPLDMHSKDVIAWFARLTKGPTGTRGGAAITAYGPNRKPIAKWSLTGVFPVRYQGPSFDVGGSSVPTETLEIGHNGFELGGASSGPGATGPLGN